MVTGKEFVTWDGKHISTLIFVILEGLMQGTVTSPRLFNILTKAVLLLFLRSKIKKYCIAYADDLIAYIAHINPSIVLSCLQEMYNEIHNHYKEWNLRINPSKCETIVFQRPSNQFSPAKREIIKDFQICHKEENNVIKIPHKKMLGT